MNILVTGGAGYIGSHTCKLLAQRDYSPITYDNLSTGHREAVKWGPFEEGDICNRARLDEVIKQYQPSAVIHFAAYSLVGESVGSPAKYYRNNVSGTLTLLEAMRDHGIKHIVFSSSCAVYGIPNKVPIPEGHPLDPISPYGRSKMMIEYLLEDFSRAYDMKNISLRYFNAAGADVDGEIGENHNPESHLIPLVLDTALGKRSAISIYGDDYNTPDGTCIRDYIHVNDLADIHVRALNYLEQNGQSKFLNIGTGKGYSVRDIIKEARKITGKEIKEIVIDRRQGDPDILLAQVVTAEKLFGWTATQSNIENIIKTAWQWHTGNQ
jgi:UDP-glucose-4-epimerase GalE